MELKRSEMERLHEGIRLLCGALQGAGVDVKDMEIIYEGPGETKVRATFDWGVKYANITIDNPQSAMWDVMRQIPELRS